ncbi:UDP-glucose 4-epimerase [Xylanibacter ruminicola]|uniref:UDP-glucose 4-epimerase n=1 Tax=Xylanibacter ruminicola TaxID=839 RepID=A0A1H4DJA3_XYLRU|nr:NAD-dependent epimerase/dehydratase family protein [Xylanibacter ruminicola]SEA72861.1 UDP-glucose 4-epimerase [Xylanibacter ruminicola]
MKILIIGKDSYIGNHIDEWLTTQGHQVVQLDVLTDEWKTFDYSPYDAIVHVAGIVHRPDCQDWELYKRVNTDMPIAIATMAKKAGVKQYVFFSTMGVYGIGKRLKPTIVDENTPLAPAGMYGKSKLMAEVGLRELQDEAFQVAFVRPPSVYGKGCRGGYITGFASIARRLPMIPRAYENVKQSFIYIDNLSELVRLIIEKNKFGVFCPQDDKAVSANELLRVIAEGIGRKYRSSRLLGLGVRLLRFIPLVNKAYGGVEYAKALSDIEGMDYVVVPFEEGMRRTVAL